MNDLEFLKGCEISPGSPDAETALKLRRFFAAAISVLPPEKITPETTCETLMAGWKPKSWFQDGLDSMEYVMELEEHLGTPILDEYAEEMSNPEYHPNLTVKGLIQNYLEVLQAQKNGIGVPPRRLSFWTDARWYHRAAWGLPMIGVLTLIGSMVYLHLLVEANALYPLFLAIVSLMAIWLGVRLWKWHRVTLDRLNPHGEYRAVLHHPEETSVLLETVDFSTYGGWMFSDSVTAGKRAREIAAFMSLPLEMPNKTDVARFRGWNPPDWDVIDTKPFFREFSAFCAECKADGFAAETDALLNRIRQASSFAVARSAVSDFCNGFPQEILSGERSALLAGMERMACLLASDSEFLKECGIKQGTLGAKLARDIRKLLLTDKHLRTLEIKTNMVLGEIVPHWFISHDETEIMMDRMAEMGDECAVLLNSIQPKAEWPIKELVQKYVDAYAAKYMPGTRTCEDGKDK